MALRRLRAFWINSSDLSSPPSSFLPVENKHNRTLTRTTESLAAVQWTAPEVKLAFSFLSLFDGFPDRFDGFSFSWVVLMDELTASPAIAKE